MGNRKAREFQKTQETSEAWRRARTVPRDPYEDVAIPGIGIRRVQVCHCPSFAPGLSWDVRELNGGWHVYQSDYAGSDLVGYDPLSISAEVLKQFVVALRGISLPVAPVSAAIAGIDGTLTELCVFGDLHSYVRFRWWSESPQGWHLLVATTERFIECIRSRNPNGA